MCKIDRKIIKKIRNRSYVLYCFGIFLFLCAISHIKAAIFSGNMKNITVMLICIFAGIFVVKAGAQNYEEYERKMAHCDYLEEHGRLVKSLEYKVLPHSMGVANGFGIEVEYLSEDGTVKKLYGVGVKEGKNKILNETVDLLIDPNDEKNYYIDFHIEEYC